MGRRPRCLPLVCWVLGTTAFQTSLSTVSRFRKYGFAASSNSRETQPLFVSSSKQSEEARQPQRAPLQLPPVALDEDEVFLGDWESFAMAFSIRRGTLAAYFLDVVRGSVSLLGIVVLWAGAWLLLDKGFLTYPEEGVQNARDAAAQAFVAIAGLAMMVSTKTFFSNANMDSVDREGSLRELGAILAEGKLRLSAKVNFYSKCVVAMFGSICFWEGAFNLVDTWTSMEYNVACAVAGAAAMLYITSSEDNAADAVSLNDAASVEKHAMRAAKHTATFLSLTRADQLKMYGRGLFGNIASVVWWKGCEDIEEGLLPAGEPWPGLALVTGGILVLWLTDRLTVNSGLSLDYNNGALSAGDVDAAAENRFSAGLGALWRRLQKVRMPDSPMGVIVTNLLELVAVTSVWTGIEWYIWDGDGRLLPAHTVGRDAVYVLGSLALLLATGTLFNQAGMVSPMALYKRVHSYVRHDDEDVALLGPDADDAIPSWEMEWGESPVERSGLEMAAFDETHLPSEESDWALGAGPAAGAAAGATGATAAAVAAAASNQELAAAAAYHANGDGGGSRQPGGLDGEAAAAQSLEGFGGASALPRPTSGARSVAADFVGRLLKRGSRNDVRGDGADAESAMVERVPLIQGSGGGGGGDGGGGSERSEVATGYLNGEGPYNVDSNGHDGRGAAARGLGGLAEQRSEEGAQTARGGVQ